VPRDAIGRDGGRTFVRVQRGSSYSEQAVTLGPLSALHAVVASGVDEGAVVARNIAPTADAAAAAPAISEARAATPAVGTPR
jgi:hypothetical protein